MDEQYFEKHGYPSPAEHARVILMVMMHPDDAARAIQEFRADAWDEGYQDGLRQAAEGEDGPRFTNPYRIEKVKIEG